VTLEKIRLDPDFIAAAKDARPPIDLDGVAEVIAAGKRDDDGKMSLTAILRLDDGQHVALTANRWADSIYGDLDQVRASLGSDDLMDLAAGEAQGAEKA